VGELQEEFAAVVIRIEDELAIVASSDDVVEPTGYSILGLRDMAASGYFLVAQISIFHA